MKQKAILQRSVNKQAKNIYKLKALELKGAYNKIQSIKEKRNSSKAVTMPKARVE